ncbi:MAG: hypothetical protein MUF24_04930 [Chitinophagaceae bacterium]|jgi:hypothetical protein|nr:hypothetical protein [Chitinophagaceae bacterium]
MSILSFVAHSKVIFSALSICLPFAALSNFPELDTLLQNKYEPTTNLSIQLGEVQIDTGTLRGKPGFYRIGKSTTGRWWLIDPSGKPMLYKGCNAVIRQEVGKAGDNMFFQWAEQTYGADYRGFINDAVTILKDAGFNGFGGWSMLFTPREGHRELGMPFVEILTPRAAANGKVVAGNIDVFDESVWTEIDKMIATSTEGLANNPNLLGYFCDNESMYGQPATDPAWTGKISDMAAPPTRPTLLQLYLALPADREGGKAAWQWILKRHGGREDNVFSAWGLPGINSRDFKEKTLHNQLIVTADTYSADLEAFSRLYVRTYYSRMQALIRKYDSNHLIMTTRCPAPPGMHVLREMKSCFDDGIIDVLAMNSYRSNLKERIDEFYTHAPLPILIGEFNWSSGHFLDWGKYLREELFTEEEKEQVYLRGRQALENAFTHPGLIGYTCLSGIAAGNLPEIIMAYQIHNHLVQWSITWVK